MKKEIWNNFNVNKYMKKMLNGGSKIAKKKQLENILNELYFLQLYLKRNFHWHDYQDTDNFIFHILRKILPEAKWKTNISESVWDIFKLKVNKWIEIFITVQICINKVLWVYIVILTIAYGSIDHFDRVSSSRSRY